MKIKICGITNYEDAYACASLRADFIGFNFYRQSKRFIAPENAKNIIEKLGGFEHKSVGIFVNEDISEIKKTIRYCKIGAVQLHGDEDILYVMKLRMILSDKIKIIKAFRIKDNNSLANIDRFNVDYFLFDSFQKNVFGGTGKAFDYSLLSGIKKEFFIAGGISLDIFKEAAAAKPFGLDINSKIESSPRKKDHKKLKEIIEAIKNETRY